MCFSAQADLVGGIVLGGIGLDVARHVHHRHEHLAIAALPLLLAVHQFDEAFVWFGLQDDVPSQVGRVATWVYLLIAFVVLPVYVPAAILALEPPGTRRTLIAAFVGLGVVVSSVLLGAMVRGPVTATLGHYHVAYSAGLRSTLPIIVAYVIATCGSLIFSGYRHIAIFGVVNLVAVAVLARLTIDGFASLWCAWAAVSSAAVAVHIRYGRPHRSVVRPLI